MCYVIKMLAKINFIVDMTIVQIVSSQDMFLNTSH
jgi:hypothetical protein